MKQQGWVIDRQGSKAVVLTARVQNGVVVTRTLLADSAHGTPPGLGTPVTVIRRPDGDELL